MVPDGWFEATLAGIAQIKGGKRMPKGRPFAPGTTAYPYIRVSDFANGSVKTTDLRYVLPEDRKAIERYTISAEDLYVSIAGTLGVFGEIPAELDGAQLTENAAKICILNRGSVDKSFLKYALLSEETSSQIHRLKGVGGGVPKLALFRIESIRLRFPPILEQRKIAAILSAMDEVIEKTEVVIEQLQIVKKAMMQELLTRGLPGRHTQFKKTEIGEIPKEWDVRLLDECIESGRPICYGILMPGKGYPGGIPVIKVKNIRDGVVEQKDLLLTSPEIDAQYARARVRPGDILLTIRGTTGRLARVPPELANANITQDSARLSIRANISTDYMFHALSSASAQRQIRDHTRGQAVKGINIGDVRKLLIAIPGNDEQARIAELFEALDRLAANTRAEREELKVTKSALMSVLLTGALRVTPETDAA